MADQHLRMKQVTGTTADWARCDIVLGNGEFGVEQTVDGVKLKVGDGASKFSSLPYVTGSGGGSVHVGTSPPAKKDDGSMWFDPKTGALKIYDKANAAWVLIVDASTVSPWTRLPNGITYSEAGKFVNIGGSMPSIPAALNVTGDVQITGEVTAGTFTGNQVTANHSDIKLMNGDRLDLTDSIDAKIARFTQSMTAGQVFVSGQGDTSGGTQVPALLGPTGQIIRGAHVVFGQIIRDGDGVYRIRFTSADGSDHDINMMGQSITNLPNASTHPEAYNMFGTGGGTVAESAASVRWVENKFGGITGMNFRGAKDVIDGGDAPVVSPLPKANDWYIVRQDSYDDKGVLQGLMSDAWWDLLTPYSKLARHDEKGNQIREVFAGDHLIWAETPNPANSGFAYIENSNHHNRFISRFGDTMAGTLTLLKKTSVQNQRPITYAGHGFNLGCFGAAFISDGITYPDGDTFSINAGGGAGASQIEFVVNDGAGTRYHQLSMAGNGSFRIPVSGSAYTAPGGTAPGGIMLQQNNVHAGAHTTASGSIAYRIVAKHDASTAKKPFTVELPVRGGTAAEILIQPTGIIDNVSPGVSMSSVVVKSQLQPYLDLTKTGSLHTFQQGIDMKGFRIINVNDTPAGDTHVVNYGYLKEWFLRYDNKNHWINCASDYKNPAGATKNRLVNVADPVNAQDAMTLKSFTDRLRTTGGTTAEAGKVPQLDGAGRIDVSMLPAGLSSALEPKGSINVTASAPTNAKNGWTYWAAASGTAHASFGLGAVKIKAGDMLIYSGGKWHVVANEIDLAAFYTKAQSDAKYALISNTYTRTAADGKFELKGTSYDKAASDLKYALKGAVHAIPAGGTASQVLAKVDTTDYNTHWVSPYTEAQADAKYALIGASYTKAEADVKHALAVLKTSLTKVGGVSHASQVAQLDATGKLATSMIPTAIAHGMQIKGSVSPTAAPPAHVSGDSYFFSKGGTLHAGYGLGAIAVNAGDMIIFSGGKWHLIANELDFSNVYTKAVSDGKYELKNVAYSKSDSDAKYALATSVHSIPTGGTTGQALVKSSNTNYAVKWTSILTDAQAAAKYALKTDSYTKAEADAKHALAVLKTSLTKVGGTGHASQVAQLDANGKLAVSMIPAALAHGMQVKGAVNPTSAPPSHVDGDAHFFSRGGTLNTGYGLGAIAVNSGDMIIFSGGKWHIVANELDLSNVYTKAVADGRFVQLAPTGAKPSQTILSSITAMRFESTLGGIHSAHSFSGQDLKGTGDRMIYTDAAGTLHAGTAYPPTAGTSGITQAQADARYHQLTTAYLKTRAPATGTQSINGSFSVGNHVVVKGYMSAGQVRGTDMAGTGNRVVYADAAGYLHAGIAYPPAAGTSGISQAQADARYLQLSGGTLTGTLNTQTLHVNNRATFGSTVEITAADLNMHMHKVVNLGDPTNNHDATNKQYVDSKVSDRRVKTSIVELGKGLDVISKLKPVSFNYSDPRYSKGKNQSKHYGFIAQDMQEVAPELVYNDPLDIDDDGNSESGLNILGFDQTELVPVLVNAIKELKEEIETLKRDLANARLS